MKKSLLVTLFSIVLAVSMMPVLSLAAEGDTAPSDFTKIATWTGKVGTYKTAEIALESLHNKSVSASPKILFLGSLCSAHGLTQDTVKTSLDTCAQYGSVDYYLFKTKRDDNSATDSIKNINAVTGTLAKNGKFDKDTLPSWQYSMHCTVYDFAAVITDAVKNNKQYDFIIMEFDGIRMGFHKQNGITTQMNSNLVVAANYLEGMYSDGRVAWIIPSKTTDLDGHTESGFNQVIYGDHYFNNQYKSSWDWQTGTYNALALIAPEDWLNEEGTGSKGLPDSHDPSKKYAFNSTLYPTTFDRGENGEGSLWVSYNNAKDVGPFLNDVLKAVYEKIVITDVVDSDFTIKSVKGYFYKDKENKWEVIPEPKGADTPKFSYEIKDQKVTGTFNTTDAPGGLNSNKVKMVISVESKGTETYTQEEKEVPALASTPTNVGKATAGYYVGKKEKGKIEVDPANLEKPVYKVEFVTDGGSDVDTQYVTSGEKATKPGTDPTKAGYTFDDWYADEDLTTEFDFENDVIEENTTIYAGYTENEGTLIYHANRGNDESVPDNQTLKTTESADISKVVPTRDSDVSEGSETVYTFQGWATTAEKANAGTVDYLASTDDATVNYKAADVPVENGQKDHLYAVWTSITNITIKYEATIGGSVSSNSEVVEQWGDDPDGSTATPDTGYHFVNWTVGENEVETDATMDPVAGTEDKPLTPITYTAHFEKNEYTVSFETYGKGGKTPDEQTVKYNEYAEKPDYPEELVSDGYTFKGWFKDSDFKEEWNFASTPVVDNTTIYAKWIKQHTVTFDANGNGTAPNPQIVDDGRTALNPGTLIADGFIFKGWFLDKEGKVPYDFSTPVTKDVILYAYWEPIVAEDTRTGDSSFMLFWTMMMLIGGLGTIGLAIKRR